MPNWGLLCLTETFAETPPIVEDAVKLVKYAAVAQNSSQSEAGALQASRMERAAT